MLQERQEYEQAEEVKRKQIAAEMERLEREAEERERQRRLEEHREIQRKAAKERIEQLRGSALFNRAIANMDEEVNILKTRLIAEQSKNLFNLWIYIFLAYAIYAIS